MNESEIRLRLEQMRRGLLERQGRLASHVAHREEPLPADFSEQATELENEETMVQLAAKVQTEIVELEASLARLAEGTYSVCQQCAAEIEPERLIALPTTKVCVACASD